MAKFLKVFVSLVFALLAAMFGVFAVAVVKAIVPIFRLTEGTQFQIYVQDPFLYIFGPLYLGYLAFRATMKKEMDRIELNSLALGVVTALMAAIITAWVIPFRSFLGPIRWLLILAQFPVIPFGVGYATYRVGIRKRSNTVAR